jgi:hypothetical protein
MISAKIIAFGKNFSGHWVNNWTGTLSFLAANNINFNWQFYDWDEPIIELNHAIASLSPQFDWLVLTSGEVVWSGEQLKNLLLNDTYDAISGWRYTPAGTSDVVQSLDERFLLHNNGINYLADNDIAIRPIPFKIEYSQLNFVAFKAKTIHNKVFSPQYIEDTNKKILLPWHFSVCKQYRADGNEIYLDPRFKMKTLVTRAV